MGRVVLGAGFLGSRPGAAALADALIASALGDVDTANIYTGGDSERMLGAAIARARGTGPGTTVHSKADRDVETGTFDGDRVRRSLDESLQRLGVDRLPLFHLHDPYSITLSEAMAKGGAVDALVKLRDEGVVGAIGIAAGRTRLVHEYVATGAFDAVLSHHRFTLVDRSAQPAFELARERGMTVLNAAPFGGGLLSGSGESVTTYGYGRVASPELLDHVARLRALAASWSVDLAAAALQFSLRSPLVDATVVGVSTLKRLEALPDLIAARIPEGFFDDLEGLGAPPASPSD